MTAGLGDRCFYPTDKVLRMGALMVIRQFKCIRKLEVSIEQLRSTPEIPGVLEPGGRWS